MGHFVPITAVGVAHHGADEPSSRWQGLGWGCSVVGRVEAARVGTGAVGADETAESSRHQRRGWRCGVGTWGRPRITGTFPTRTDGQGSAPASTAEAAGCVDEPLSGPASFLGSTPKASARACGTRTAELEDWPSGEFSAGAVQTLAGTGSAGRRTTVLGWSVAASLWQRQGLAGAA